jgi:hypothetical protein
MADATVVQLQQVINRYAYSQRISPIGVDSIAGSQTQNAAQVILGAIASKGTNPVLPDTITTTAENYLGATTSPAVLAQNAAPLAGFLTSVADQLSLPAISAAPPPTTVASGGGAHPVLNLPNLNPGGASASLLQSIKGLPTWAKLLGGVLAGLGVIWAYNKFKGGQALHGLSDMYLVDAETGEKVRRATPHEVQWFQHKGRIDLPNHAARGGGTRRYAVIDA